MKVFQSARIFLEQVEYPEQTREERFLFGLRRRSVWPFWVRNRYHYIVQVTESGVKTYWGAEQKRWWGESDIDELRKRLVGALCADSPLEMGAFQVVKQLPEWPLAADQTLALELKESPAVFEAGGRIETKTYPEMTCLTVGDPTTREIKLESLLEIVREVVQSTQAKGGPVVVQVVFQSVWAGSTREEKRTREAGKRWREDMYRKYQTQVKLLERTLGKIFGYWMVTIRILTPSGFVELESALNRLFTFQRVRASRAIKQYQRKRFGRVVRMSSVTLRRSVQIPTAEIFPREMLGVPTTGQGLYGRWHTRPFPNEGYIVGRNENGGDICIDDTMLRSHVLLVGQTGCGKTSLMRFLALELARPPQNRLFIFDYAGEYSQLLQHLQGEVVLFRPGSEDFPLGINFLDWAQTLEVDVDTAESWIMRVLETLIRGRGRGEFTPKMVGMLREMLLHELKKGGTLFDLFEDLWKLRTRFQQKKRDLGRRKATGEILTEAEEVVQADYGQHDLTVEAIQNRLRDLYGSPLRQVFFVRRTTVRAEDLLKHHVIVDLSLLRKQGVSNELLRLFCEFLLLYLSRGVAKRQKSRFPIRNIVIFEEAQQLVPEILTKQTLVDGTAPEELIGTLGGFGLTLFFISAQPGMLSRAIISGCHTKMVFGLQGVEASLLADALGVPTREVSGLQVRECLVRATGTGVVKAAVRTWREYSETDIAVLEAGLWNSSSEFLQQAWKAYEFLGNRSLKYYETLVEVIEQAEDSFKEEDQTEGLEEDIEAGCWAASHCNLCQKTPNLRETASNILKGYRMGRSKEQILQKINTYHFDPLIMFNDILEFVRKDGIPNAELIAFCTHWLFLEECLQDEELRAKCPEFFTIKKTKHVDSFMQDSGIQKLIDISSELFNTRTSFSFRDEFCELCPLDKSLRNEFCTKYRHASLQKLDKTLIQRLKVLYETGYDLFLQSCFDYSNNPSFAYCLATTFLKGCKMTSNQRAIILEKTKNYLSETEAKQYENIASNIESDIETINITENKESIDTKE